MERYELLNKLAKPLDMVLEGGIELAKTLGVLDPFRDNIYNLMKDNMRKGFDKNNHLEILGLENVPAEGGCIIAANHQSWLDVQVIGASSERRLHFIAKNEFAEWPILSKMIEISESVYIKRGGDSDGLQNIVDRLKEGWAIVIFPEGTIPGEEEVSRAELEQETGLLKGRSGVTRLAILAGVPVIPVGISGTGQAYPPEAYPRIEMPPVQKPLPITIKYGKPLYLPEKNLADVDKATIRKHTNEIMKAISDLVDHSRCFVPIEVPMKKPDTSGLRFYPKKTGKSKWGALVIHGFTSHIDCVSGIAPFLKKNNIAYRFPILRGHGTVPHDMVDVTFQDWYEDAEQALFELSEHADNIIVMGLSMGGLMSIELGRNHPELVNNVILVAAALKFADPMSALSPILSKLFKFWDSPNSYNDEHLKSIKNRNYPFFATAAFSSLYENARSVEKNLGDFDRDVLILQSKKDTVVAPKAAEIIYKKISSSEKKIEWFKESGHEMLLDLESEKVLQTIEDYISGVIGTPEVIEKTDASDSEKKK